MGWALIIYSGPIMYWAYVGLGFRLKTFFRSGLTDLF